MNARAHGDIGDIEGLYANHMQVASTEDEFVLEFGQDFQETREMKIHTRIVTSPESARGFLDTLARSIREHKRGRQSGR